MSRSFEGWYFKQQSSSNTIALIPARHVGEDGHRSASLQIVLQGQTYTVPYPIEQFCVDRRDFSARLGESEFGMGGVRLCVQTPDLHARGEWTFGNPILIKPDIMGPFRYVPFMQCRHSILSMGHRLCGWAEINGRRLEFPDGAGYIEGDRGRCFPRRYLWTQCFLGGPNQTLMLSVADIPFAGGTFTGVIAQVCYGGTHYRLATYFGARAVLSPRAVTIRQGSLMLTAQALGNESAVALKAPILGRMNRMIKEHLLCTVRYRLSIREKEIFDITSEEASFEDEYHL